VVGTSASQNEHLLAAISGAVERHWQIAIVVSTVLFFATSIARAAVKPFWHDEIYTVAGASLSSLQTIWTAQRAGLDLGPPLISLVLHGLFTIGGAGLISGRLPDMVGFWTMSLIVFAIVRRRSNAVAALGAMWLPLLTPVGAFAVEARGYGLVLGLFAVALYAWSEAADNRQPRAFYLVVMAIAITMGVWAHYYAALVFLPIAAGELARWLNTKKADWAMWSALAAASAGIVPLYALVEISVGQAATYWRHAAWSDVFEVYTLLTGPLFGAMTLISLGAVGFGLWRREAADRKLDVAAHEVVAAIVTLLLPIVAIAAGILTINVFVPRYVLFVVVAVVVLLPLAAWRFGPRSGLAEVALTAAIIVGLWYMSRDLGQRTMAGLQNPVDARPMLKSELAGSRPVVVTGILYLQMWYYAPPELRARVLYLTDPAAAEKILGSDTLDRGYLSLRRWYPVTVKDYAPFVKSRTPFVLYSTENLTWQPAKLREDGAHLREIGKESRATVYDVTFP